jgi:hypothetical protein
VLPASRCRGGGPGPGGGWPLSPSKVLQVVLLAARDASDLVLPDLAESVRVAAVSWRALAVRRLYVLWQGTAVAG